jgi:hypothetical protein
MTPRTLLTAVSVVAGVALTLVGALAAGGVPSVHAEKPEITFQFPTEGAVLNKPPLVLQMCFKKPVDVRDLPPLNEGDFHFSLTRPDRIQLGMRIVFQPDGYGVSIYPGTADPDPPAEGEWTWTYRVVDGETKDPLEGEVKFTTNAASGGETLQPPPSACLPEGATQQPTAQASGTENAPPPATVPPATESDGDTDVLTIALIAGGIAAAGAVTAGVAFVIRRRMGSNSELPPGGESGPGDGGQP